MIAVAQTWNVDLVSMMVKLHCSSFAERALIPAFVFFFFMVYPQEWVNNPKRRTAAAAGGDILVRVEALAMWGGAGWLLMSIAFWPMVRFYSLSPLWAALLPLIALFYTAATLHSAVQYWAGRGGSWKGRVQDGRGGFVQ